MTRNDLAKMFEGVGVELGVAAGHYSDQILRNPRVTKLFSIDAWDGQYGHDVHEYNRVAKHLNCDRCLVVRAYFDIVVTYMDDGCLDFVYIDGFAHTGQQGGKTLEDWWPKVKEGGLFCGHDYHERWRPTMIAVDKFVAKHNLTFELTERDQYPSWIIRK